MSSTKLTKTSPVVRVFTQPRPPKNDSARDDYDSDLRFLWRIFIILVTVIVIFATHDLGVGEGIAIVSEKAPDLLKEIAERIERL